MLRLQGDTRGVCYSQHKLLVANFHFHVRARMDKQTKIERTKWWKLKGETSEVFRERVIKKGSWKEKRGHKQHVGEDGNQHSESGLRGVWSNQMKWRRG